MNFLTDLRNFIRCAFCTRINCSSRFSVGSRHYYSHLGFVSVPCPKKCKSTFLSAKEIREKILKNANKEKND